MKASHQNIGELHSLYSQFCWEKVTYYMFLSQEQGHIDIIIAQ